MEGAWKFNPFYWMALDRLDRANQNQKSLSLARSNHSLRHGLKLNPLRWSSRTLRVFFVSLFMILAPFYFFSGIQPVSSIEATSYPELRLPEIDLATPVAPLEMTERQLIAPATIAGSYSQAPNKQFIIGHSSTVFRNLNQATLYQHLYYNDIEYTITEVEVLAKADVDMTAILDTADVDTIIIMTCAGTPLPEQDATHRLIVTAERTQPKSQNYVNNTTEATETTTSAKTPTASISNFIVTPEA